MMHVKLGLPMINLTKVGFYKEFFDEHIVPPLYLIHLFPPLDLICLKVLQKLSRIVTL